MPNKKKYSKKLYIYLVLIFTLITSLSLSVKKGNDNLLSRIGLELLAPPNKMISSIKNSSVNFMGSVIPKNDKDKKIEDLEIEVEKLRTQLIKNTVTESELKQLSDLKQSLNFIEEDYEKNYVTASIVGKNDGNYYTSFTISAGKNQNVQKDGIVLTGKGLVGRIYEVSDNYSKAISILDSKSSVSFQVLREERYTGIASQNVTMDYEYKDFEGYIKGYLFDINYKVLPGDIIITSGLGLYPKGIPIGSIDKIIEDKNNLLKYVKIKPYVNLKKIDKVMILNPRDFN
ncbi:putative rod shape-determining protein precursor [Acetoanaerobium sticklandii]|uniref:Cell shape-determining protein MreC n=1 Tax=Acetoanaerobium sticklandii (strain ATCC 12662 / DSM 519 / JCM 1433 / CCUG 9281 / NCIMB 10654 / HF) TaxID=499177 RepID=E3PRL0_ACESD|nr:rod shape-determining protein MreC [Acetoanaerobium sticklandii]CBH21514.1 putative rod shape-determining protein precursor [Acetoanaerobium sticklandii]